MAFTDAVLAIICTSCAVPLWANGTEHFNPVRLVPFVTTFLVLSRLWEKQCVRSTSCLMSCCRSRMPHASIDATDHPCKFTSHHPTPRPKTAVRTSAA